MTIRVPQEIAGKVLDYLSCKDYLNFRSAVKCIDYDHLSDVTKKCNIMKKSYFLFLVKHGFSLIVVRSFCPSYKELNVTECKNKINEIMALYEIDIDTLVFNDTSGGMINLYCGGNTRKIALPLDEFGMALMNFRVTKEFNNIMYGHPNRLNIVRKYIR